jgi:hypothetical protein
MEAHFGPGTRASEQADLRGFKKEPIAALDLANVDAIALHL